MNISGSDEKPVPINLRPPLPKSGNGKPLLLNQREPGPLGHFDPELAELARRAIPDVRKAIRQVEKELYGIDSPPE